MECISNGIVTITNNLPGGIRDMVTEKVGFLCQLNDTKEFANHIKKLYSDRQLLFYMQNNCFEEASKSYDVTRNADKYFELFGRFDEFRKEVNSHSLPSLKFDNPFLPNFLMVIVRKAIRFRQRKSKKA
jgi:hypothetical protein